jgi:membrane dipeptidase
MKASSKPLDRARDLLQKIPLVDGHNDLPYVIWASPAKGDVAAWNPGRPHQEHDTDIPRLREGLVAAQFWAAFIPTLTPHPGRSVLELVDIILQLTQNHPETFLAARRASDIARAKRQGKIASFIAIEGGVGLENSLAPLRVWQAAGARLMTLCHNETLDWVDSATDAPRHGGLTAFGRAVIAELNRLGMIVDLAHVSHDVMRQVLDITRAPVVFSHSNAFSLCDHPRNVPDDVLDRVKANGGLVMATFVPTFISQEVRDWYRPFCDAWGKAPLASFGSEHRPAAGRERPRATLEQLCDHIEYLAARAGLAHVGIGSDFFGGHTPVGLEHVGRFPDLIAELMRRGWSDVALAGIASRNFVRVFRAVERTGESLRRTETARVGRIEDFDEPGRQRRS